MSNTAAAPYKGGVSVASQNGSPTSPPRTTLSPAGPLRNGGSGRTRRAVAESRRSPQLTPTATAPRPVLSAPTDYNGPRLTLSSKGSTPIPRRSRDSSPASPLYQFSTAPPVLSGVSTNGSTYADANVRGDYALHESSMDTLPQLTPPPPLMKYQAKLSAFSPVKGPGLRVEPTEDDAEAVVGDERHRSAKLTVHASSIVPSSRESSSAVPLTETESSLVEKSKSVWSVSTNGTFSAAPQDSSTLSGGSFRVTSEVKSGLVFSLSENGSDCALHSGGTDEDPRHRLRSSDSGEIHTSCRSASSEHEDASSPSSLMCSESRLSRCKRKLQCISTPAFDLKVVEEINQHVMLLHTRRGEEGWPEGGEGRARKLRGGCGDGCGDDALQLRLPGGAECGYYEEGICNAAECHPITKVSDFIYLGTWRDANSAETLRQHGITYVLNCAKEVDHSAESGSNAALRHSFDLEHYDESLLYAADDDDGEGEGSHGVGGDATAGDDSRIVVGACIPLSDSQKERLDKCIEAAFFFISLARKRRANVLVHCRRGISRSAAVVIAFLMATEKKSFRETYEAVLRKRPCVSLNLGFHEFLEEAFVPHPKWVRLHEQLNSRDARSWGKEAAGHARGPLHHPLPLPVPSGRGRCPALPPPFGCPPPDGGDEDYGGEEEPFSPFRKSLTHTFHASFGHDSAEEEGQRRRSEHESCADEEGDDGTQPIASLSSVRVGGGAPPPRDARAPMFGLSRGLECVCSFDDNDAEEGPANGKHCVMAEGDCCRCQRRRGPHKCGSKGTVVMGFPSDDAREREEEEEDEETITPPSGRLSDFTDFPSTAMHYGVHPGLSGQASGRHSKLVSSHANSLSASSTAGGCTTVDTSHSSRTPDVSTVLSKSRTPPQHHSTALHRS